MNKHILPLASLFVAVALCTACATPPVEGPGMMVTFNNTIIGKRLSVLRANTSNRIPFPTPGSLGPYTKPNPTIGGATMGAAPDGRELPEWVEFEWKEWPYPYPTMPSDPVARQAWSDGVHAMSGTLPIQTARVAVRSRVPRDVVDEVLASKKRRLPKCLPDAMLWVYFIWYESGIKFHWSLDSRCCGVLREGGDELGQ